MSIYWSIFMTACCFEAEELVLIEGRTQDPSSTVRGERRGRYEYLWVLRWKEPQWKASVSLGKGNKRGHQGFCHVKKLNSSGLIRSYRARQMNTSYCSQCPVLVCRAKLTVSLFWPPPPFSRVRRVLQPLPEWGPGHAVCHLQRLHVPVCHLPRGCARVIQLLPGLWTRGAHQPHDGVVSDPGGVSHRLWVPLPAWKHFLTHSPRALWEVLEGPSVLADRLSARSDAPEPTSSWTAVHSPQRLTWCGLFLSLCLLSSWLLVAGMDVGGRGLGQVETPASRAVFTSQMLTSNHRQHPFWWLSQRSRSDVKDSLLSQRTVDITSVDKWTCYISWCI